MEALELMKTNSVAIIGPKSSLLSHFISHAASELQVPLLSFGAAGPILSSYQFPYFFRMIHSDLFLMIAVTDLLNFYGCKNITCIYQDDDYGRNRVSALSDALENVRAKVRKAVLPPEAHRNRVSNMLMSLALLEERVFVVHVESNLGMPLLVEASNLGMLSNGYVWITTDWLLSVLDIGIVDPETINALNGVVALRPYITLSEKMQAFTERWKTLYKKRAIHDHLNVFGFYAYDAVWAVANSIETFLSEGGTFSFIDFHYLTIRGADDIKLLKLKAFSDGKHMQNLILKSKFTGLSGPVEFNKNGELVISTFEIINIVGTGYRKVGYRSENLGLSTSSLKRTGESTENGCHR